MTIGNGQTSNFRRTVFAGMKTKTTMQTSRTALAIDDAGVRIAVLRTNRDGLAEEIDIAVARSSENAIGQCDDVPSSGSGHGGLDGREIAAAVGSDDPGAGKCNINGEGLYG